MKMEGRKISLFIRHSGTYMDISDDLRLRLLQSLLLQVNSWLVEYTEVQVLSQNCHQKNPTTSSPSPNKNPKAAAEQWQSHFTVNKMQSRPILYYFKLNTSTCILCWLIFLNLSCSKSLFSQEPSFKEMNGT